jgi:hypothetical protein
MPAVAPPSRRLSGGRLARRGEAETLSGKQAGYRRYGVTVLEEKAECQNLFCTAVHFSEQ